MTPVTLGRRSRCSIMKQGQDGNSRPASSSLGESKMIRSATRGLFVCALALTVFLAGCNRDPNVRKQKYFDSGEKYFQEGKYREAAIQFSNAIQIDSRFANAHSELAQTYLKLGDSQRAFQELSRTVELAPDNYRAHIDLANLLVTVRNPDGSPRQEYMTQAKAHLDVLRDKDPNDPETHEAWANYYAAENDLPHAIQEIQQAINLKPDRSESYLLLALFELRANLPDQAEASFKKAVSTDPKSTSAVLALGGFYQSRNRLPEAEQQFHNAIALEPSNPGPRAAMVRLLMAEGRKAETEAFLEQTKKDIPNNSEGYRMLGDFYFANGELDKAVTEYASLYKDHPRDPQVKKNYIQLLILKGKLEDAAKLNNEILKSAPRDVDALVYKAQIQLRQGDAAGASDSLQTALRNDPDNAVAHYQLGLALEQQRDQDRAESEWREAVRLKPELTDAQRSLAMLAIRRGDLDALIASAQAIIATQPYAPD